MNPVIDWLIANAQLSAPQSHSDCNFIEIFVNCRMIYDCVVGFTQGKRKGEGIETKSAADNQLEKNG